MGLSGTSLGSVQRGNVHHVNSSIPQHAESHAASTAIAQSGQKSQGGWDQKGLNGASQRCAQPCQELSHILVRQAQSRFRKKIWVRDHGRWVKTVQQCRGTWMKSHQGGLVLVLGWQNGENSLLLVLLLLLHLHHRDISWPHKEGTWLGLGKISSHIGTKPEKSTVFQQITYEKGSEGNT